MDKQTEQRHPIRVRDLMGQLRHFTPEELESEIMSMPASEVCAQDCIAVLVAASRMADFAPDARNAVITAALAQCRVFYFG